MINFVHYLFHFSAHLQAEVAKLVDALDSESSPVKGVGVRVPSSAPSTLSIANLEL